MKISRPRTLFVATFLALGCAVQAAPVEPPPPPPPDTAAPAPAPAPTAPEPAATAAPTAAPTASAPPAEVKPPPRPLKDVLGKVASIEVREVDLAKGTAAGPDAVKSTRLYDKPADIDPILKAIGLDQTATGPKRRCPDDVQVLFFDDARGQKGVLGLCGKLDGKDDLSGGEFGADMSDRAGVNLADAPALKRALAKAKPGKPKADAPKKDAPKTDAPKTDAAKDKSAPTPAAPKKDAPQPAPAVKK